MDASNIPKDRVHQKVEVRYLIESESPAIYMCPYGWITSNAWEAYSFKSYDEAASWLEENRFHWDKETSIGEKDWRILDHVFYV